PHFRCVTTWPRRPPSSPPCPYTTLFRSSRRTRALNPVTKLRPRAGRPAARRVLLFAALAAACSDPAGPDRPTQLVAGSALVQGGDRKSTRLNSSHVKISYAVLWL